MTVENQIIKANNSEMENGNKQKTTPGLNLAGYFQSASGLGEGVRSTVRALKARNVPFVLNNCNFNLEYHKSETGVNDFSIDNPHPVNVVQINADSMVRFVNSFGKDYLKNRYNIGFWLWEMLRFPREWFYAFSLFDEIWTPSNFCVEAIAAVSPIPVVKIPLAIDLPAPALTRADVGLPHDKFVFLFIFDFCSSSDRKNPAALIAAFLKAFGADNKDVLLFIKSANADVLPVKAAEMRARAAGAGNIKFVDQKMSRDEINNLIFHSDCYVSLHRAEGFGLTPAEAMFYGKPVIATNYSANTDFMNVNNSFPVKYRLKAVEENFGFFIKGDLWADADVEHAAEMMRFVFENPAEAKRVGTRAAEDIRENLSPSKVGQQIESRLEIISDLTENFAHNLAGEAAKARSEYARARVEFAEAESQQMQERVRMMEESRFWKIRNQWFKLKRTLGVTKEY
jgi:glycosyltransferase involved in cell wall biosynthesis